MQISDSHNDSRSGVREVRLHARAEVSEVLASRYDGLVEDSTAHGYRPAAWDERLEGVDTVRTSSGEVLRLYSTGGQSVPKPGWVVVITGGSFQTGYTWTLYGIPAVY